LDSTQARAVWCHYALTNQIAATAVVVIAAIAIRITVSAVGIWPVQAKTAKSASAKSASVMPASVMTAGSGRYGWRNQANCRYCEQNDDRFTQHCFVLVEKRT
jgi:hypothetical protein